MTPEPLTPARDTTKAAQSATEALGALEWSPLCGCTHHGGCTRPATHIVRVHAIGSCGAVNRDADGNYVRLRCALCVSQMRAEIARELVKINQYGMAACPSCGAPMVSASDVLREVEVLK